MTISPGIPPSANCHLNCSPFCPSPTYTMAPLSLKALTVAALAGLAPLVSAIGQKQIITFESSDDTFQIAGGDIGAGQIRVSKDEYWGVVRAAGDLAIDFGRVTGTNYTLSNGEADASPAEYKFKPADVSDNTVVSLHR